MPGELSVNANMKYLIMVFCLLLSFPAIAGGPSIPDGYRMPNALELSSPKRDTDEYRYGMAAGDFNGDGLVDGASLLIDNDNKELTVFVFLCTDKDQVYRWYKVDSLSYFAIKFTGVRLQKPQKISYYPDIKTEVKSELVLFNDSFELFQFEGSSSVFYYEKESDKFKRVWVRK